MNKNNVNDDSGKEIDELKKELSSLLQGSPEIREKNSKSYIYLHFREHGKLKTRYAGERSDALLERIKNDNLKAKALRKLIKKFERNMILERIPVSSSDKENQLKVMDYLADRKSKEPLFICGEAWQTLRLFPDSSLDCILTSPPYYMKREYGKGSLGLESSYKKYLADLMKIFKELFRILKPAGSFWLNIGDSYEEKSLLNIPGRLAIALTDIGFIERNEIIWDKVKGSPDSSEDRLRNSYEKIFHFVKQRQGFYYQIDALRNKSPEGKEDGTSATGVNGKKYLKLIASSSLTTEEKEKAVFSLKEALSEVKDGNLADFRMVIRGQEKTIHSSSERFSGRQRELQEKGFYLIKYNPKGSKPTDIWRIIPEDESGLNANYAAFPEDLALKPLQLTCPSDGIVLDPFCGTGTVNKAACDLELKSIGIDISEVYLKGAEERCGQRGKTHKPM
jgi:DNA modification methylase